MTTISQKSASVLPSGQKLFWMFAPLVLLFVAIGLIALDLRHPVVRTSDCQIVATGLTANRLRTESNLLYVNSGQKVHDIGLHCPDRLLNHGIVIVNDFDAFISGEVNVGDGVMLTQRDYQLLPTRWNLALFRAPH